MTTTTVTTTLNTTTPTAANDNTARPAWYDEKVIAHRPFMRRFARKFVPAAELDDFLQEVYVLAFSRYRHFRPEQYAFSTWIGMLVRNAASDRLLARSRKKNTGTLIDIEKIDLSTPATQDESAELAAVMRAMPAGRDGEVVMRIAFGDELLEIGRDMGLSKQRVHQIGERGRQKIRSAMAFGDLGSREAA